MASKLVRTGGVVAALALVLAACAAASTGLAPAEAESPGAQRANDIYYLVSALAIGVFLAVALPLALFVVRYRGRGRDRHAEGPQIRGNTNLELAWTFVPVVLLAIVGAYVFYKLPGITDLARGGEPSMTVRVEGRQFYWQYEYPNGVVAIDRLVLPVDRVTELEITAPDSDVIHSFWVPALAGKLDAIPGHVNRLQVQPDRIGTWLGACGEFCGLQHAAMQIAVDIMDADEFDAWLAGRAEAQASGESELGKEIWEGVCAKCHGPGVVGEVGPELRGNAVLTNRESMERILREGVGKMPAVGTGWSERQMDAILDHLEGVAKEAPDGG